MLPKTCLAKFGHSTRARGIWSNVSEPKTRLTGPYFMCPSALLESHSCFPFRKIQRGWNLKKMMIPKPEASSKIHLKIDGTRRLPFRKPKPPALAGPGPALGSDFKQWNKMSELWHKRVLFFSWNCENISTCLPFALNLVMIDDIRRDCNNLSKFRWDLLLHGQALTDAFSNVTSR